MVVYWLLLLFIGVPLLELYLLYRLTLLVSFAGTLLIVIGTGVLGTWLARWEGRKTLARIQQRLSEGAVPPDPLLDGGLILVAGALLITPGVLTDAAGFFLLAPFTRPLVREYVKKWFRGMVQSGGVQFRTFDFRQTKHTDEEPPEQADYDIDVTPEDRED